MFNTLCMIGASASNSSLEYLNLSENNVGSQDQNDQ
jgi:hypothetical protein